MTTLGSSLSCADVQGMLDAFVDDELPAATLLDVARHGEQCNQCQTQMQSLTSLGHMLGVTIRRDAAALDLSGVWAGIERRLDAVQTAPTAVRMPPRWRRLFRGPALPAWGTAAAIAASAIFYLQPAGQIVQPIADRVGGKPTLIVARDLWHKTDVERIKVRKGSDVQVRHLPKDGTTAVWVSYSPDGPR